MKLGIFGGTFNPIHLAHLQVAVDARKGFDLDRVLFLPAADPPHKPVAGGASFHDRLQMVELALADQPAFEASDLEARLPGKSYSVRTLERLQQQYPDADLYFIIGLDSFRDFSTWYNYARIVELAHLIVVHRPGICDLDPWKLLPVALQNQFCYSSASRSLEQVRGNAIHFCEETCLDISSTDIRQRIAAGRAVTGLVPTAVADYIATRRLYGAGSN